MQFGNVVESGSEVCAFLCTCSHAISPRAPSEQPSYPPPQSSPPATFPSIHPSPVLLLGCSLPQRRRRRRRIGHGCRRPVPFRQSAAHVVGSVLSAFDSPQGRPDPLLLPPVLRRPPAGEPLIPQLVLPPRRVLLHRAVRRHTAADPVRPLPVQPCPSPAPRLPPRGAAEGRGLRPGGREGGDRDLRRALPRSEHRDPGAGDGAVGAVRGEGDLRGQGRVQGVLRWGGAGEARTEDGARLAQEGRDRARHVQGRIRSRQDCRFRRGKGLQSGLCGRRRWNNARCYQAFQRNPPPQSQSIHNRHPQNSRQRHRLHRQVLRLPDRCGNGAAGDQRSPRRSGERRQRHRPRQAHGEEHRAHRAPRHTQQPRSRLLPDPRERLLPRRQGRPVRVPRRAPEEERPRGGRGGRGSRAGAHPEDRDGEGGEGRVRQPGLPGRGSLAEVGAEAVVGQGPRRGALHREVHRPDVHDQGRAGERHRQPLLHAAGALCHPWSHGRVHGVRHRADQRELRLHPHGGRCCCQESGGDGMPQLGLGEVRHEPAGFSTKQGRIILCFDFD